MKLHLVMPMGGGGTRFGNSNFNVPKPLIKIYEKPFFFWAAHSIIKFIDVASITFVVLREHINKFAIDLEIKKYFPDAKIVVIEEVLPGAVLTCLNGIADIPDDEPLLFNDCDHLFLCSEFYNFCNEKQFEKVDGGLLTFNSNDARFSYAMLDKDGFVTCTVEKEAVSNCAICGAYYFRNKKIFSEAAAAYLKTCEYKEFFVSGVYNVMANSGQKVCVFQTDAHVSFGTPEEYEAAKNDETWKRIV